MSTLQKKQTSLPQVRSRPQVDAAAAEQSRLEADEDLGRYYWKPRVDAAPKADRSVVAAGSGGPARFVQRKVDRLRDDLSHAVGDVADAAAGATAAPFRSAAEARGRRNAMGREALPLIVCASLVDKVPNLAGLARTCEVFACEAIVLPDAKVSSSKEFKQIAVTAEQWIPCPAVPPAGLREWLVERRGSGYAVVALEQATNSRCLATGDLPPTPAVLLLGAEGEGVPLELMDLVDYCVEIPQRGVVRSLNVHVSGAIAVWMFSRAREMREKV